MCNTKRTSFLDQSGETEFRAALRISQHDAAIEGQILSDQDCHQIVYLASQATTEEQVVELIRQWALHDISQKSEI